MWAFEQSLGSGACDVVMAWARRLRTREIRRLQLAAERGRTLGILFRSQSAARESSPAILRMAVEPLPQGTARHSPEKPWRKKWLDRDWASARRKLSMRRLTVQAEEASVRISDAAAVRISEGGGVRHLRGGLSPCAVAHAR